MDIDSLKVKAFYQLALDKSFSKAARSLGITQPGLSQKISRLEEELETTLVIRSQREVSLTDAGFELIRYYQTKVELDQSFFQSIKLDQPNLISEIRIAGFSSVTSSVIIPLLELLTSELGQFRFDIFSREMHDLEKSLLDGEADFVISHNEIHRERIVNICVGEEENVHIVPKQSKMAMKDLPFLDHDNQDSTTYNFFKIQNKKPDFRRSYLDDIYGIIKGVEVGIGQAIASKHILKDNSKVKILRYKNRMKSKIYLSFFDKTFYTESQKTLIDLFKKSFSSFL